MNLPEALLVALLLGFGTARAAAIIAIDEISEPIRDLIFHWFPPEDDAERGFFYQPMQRIGKDELAKRDHWDIPWWQKRWEHTGDKQIRKPSFLGKLLQCHKCVAVWVAAGNTALYFAWQDAALVLNVFLAAALVSAVLNKHLYK